MAVALWLGVVLSLVLAGHVSARLYRDWRCRTYGHQWVVLYDAFVCQCCYRRLSEGDDL